eukprot:Opistho-2@42998
MMPVHAAHTAESASLSTDVHERSRDSSPVNAVTCLLAARSSKRGHLATDSRRRLPGLANLDKNAPFVLTHPATASDTSFLHRDTMAARPPSVTRGAFDSWNSSMSGRWDRCMRHVSVIISHRFRERRRRWERWPIAANPGRPALLVFPMKRVRSSLQFLPIAASTSFPSPTPVEKDASRSCVHAVNAWMPSGEMEGQNVISTAVRRVHWANISMERSVSNGHCPVTKRSRRGHADARELTARSHILAHPLKSIEVMLVHAVRDMNAPLVTSKQPGNAICSSEGRKRARRSIVSSLRRRNREKWTDLTLRFAMPTVMAYHSLLTGAHVSSRSASDRIPDVAPISRERR